MAQALEKLFRQKLSQMPQEEQIIGGKERIKKGKTEKFYVFFLSLCFILYECVHVHV